MADPTAPPTQEELNATATAADGVSKSMDKLGTTVDAARSLFTALEGKLSSVSDKFNANGRMTENQATAFGLLTVEVLGARKAFDQLDGISVKGLHSFTGQWEDLKATISNSPIAKQAGIMTDALKRLGLDTSTVDEAAKKGTKALSGLAASFFESADNGLRLQNAMVQLAARTGNLGELTKAAGPHLENMNLLLATQQQAVTDASQATKNSAKDVEQYYAQLGKIPGALQSTTEVADEAGSSVSLLTATIQFAKGSGREYSAVVTDMHEALKNYNLSAEDAFKFTSRMTEISTKFGVEFEDVQKSLKETSNLFRMFGSDTDGAARMMNNYLGALKDTGLSGKNALEVINSMSSGIKGMSLAQRSFLSAQSGGPGGLMGGFQIEKMLKDGKMNDVMEMVRKQMTKQFGSIATLEDASSSQQGAAQFNRQRMMLTQGPLAKLAQDPEQATRILQAFKARESGGAVEDLSKNFAQETMKTGVDLQEKSVTILDRIRELMEAQQGAAGAINLGTAQKMLTAGTGSGAPGEQGDPMADMRTGLHASSEKAGKRSAETTDIHKDELKSKVLIDRSATFAAQIIQDYKGFFDDLAPALKGPIDRIQKLLKAGDKGSAQKEYDTVLQNIQAKEKEAQNMPEHFKSARMKEIGIQKQMLESAYSTLSTTDGNVGYKKPGAPGEAKQTQPAEAVHAAATRSSTTGAKTAEAAAPTKHAAHSGAPGNQEVTVRVEGYCIDCGEKMKGSQQIQSAAKGTAVPK